MIRWLIDKVLPFSINYSVSFPRLVKGHERSAAEDQLSLSGQTAFCRSALAIEPGRRSGGLQGDHEVINESVRIATLRSKGSVTIVVVAIAVAAVLTNCR